MNTKNKIIIYSVIILLIIGFVGQYKYYKSEVKRLNNNYQAERIEHERIQNLTKKELKKYEDSVIVLAKKLDIKLKNIETVIVTKYNYIDTVVKTYKTVYDTIIGANRFEINKDCYNLSGVSYKDEIKITHLQMNDKLTTFVYKDYDKHFLFIKWKPYYTSKIYSKCKQDIIQVDKSIKLIKKKRLWNRKK